MMPHPPRLFRMAARAAALASMLSLTAASFTQAQPVVELMASSTAPVPFAVGEELVYRARFGRIPAGTARMRVEGIDSIRGRAAYHLVFTIDGGIPLFRVHDRYDSWIDVETLVSLRHRQSISEGRYRRVTTYELFPERAEYQKNDEAPQASVAAPLDDGSFIYAVRIAGVQPGDTLRSNRYFKPEKNPVVLVGVRTDTVSVPAGTFATTIVRPTIKTTGIFSDHGEAQVWLTNDGARYPVQVKSKFSRFTITLALQSVTTGLLAVR
jgi:hypothetical protein